MVWIFKKTLTAWQMQKIISDENSYFLLSSYGKHADELMHSKLLVFKKLKRLENKF